MNEIPWWSGFLLFEVDPKTFHCITHCPGVISDVGMTMSSMYCHYDIRRSFLVCFFSLYILRWSPCRLFFPFVDLFSVLFFCTMSWVVQSRPSFCFVTFITTVFGSVYYQNRSKSSLTLQSVFVFINDLTLNHFISMCVARLADESNHFRRCSFNVFGFWIDATYSNIFLPT